MRGWIAVAALLFTAVIAAEERRSDFAYSAPLNLDPGAGIYETPLPPEVYRRVVYPDLRDVRVFNGGGEMVPYSLRRPPTSSSVRQASIAVPLFPLHGDAAKALDALRIVVADRGASVQIQTPAIKTGVASLVGYLVDLRERQESIVALELNWRESMPRFATSVTLAASDDLASWHTIAADAPIVNLEFAGQQLRENRIEFSALKTKYLRISWSSKAPALDLLSIDVEPVAARIEAQRQKSESVGVAAGEGIFEFDLQLQAPVDQVTVRLPEINSVVSATLWSRSKRDAPWKHVAQSVLYRLRHEDRELSNSALGIAPNADRYWRVTGERAGFGAGAPRLTAAWVPVRLVFLARGSPPFELAVGNNMAASAESPLAALVGDDAVLAAGTERIAPSQAVVGEFLEAGGTQKLSQRPTTNWKNWALWSVLIVGVALLAWMARRLSSEMNSN